MTLVRLIRRFFGVSLRGPHHTLQREMTWRDGWCACTTRCGRHFMCFCTQKSCPQVIIPFWKDKLKHQPWLINLFTTWQIMKILWSLWFSFCSWQWLNMGEKLVLTIRCCILLLYCFFNQQMVLKIKIPTIYANKKSENRPLYKEVLSSNHRFLGAKWKATLLSRTFQVNLETGKAPVPEAEAWILASCWQGKVLKIGSPFATHHFWGANC